MESRVIFTTEAIGCDCQYNVPLNHIFRILRKGTFGGYMRSHENQLCLALRAVHVSFTSPAN